MRLREVPTHIERISGLLWRQHGNRSYICWIEDTCLYCRERGNWNDGFHYQIRAYFRWGSERLFTVNDASFFDAWDSALSLLVQ